MPEDVIDQFRRQLESKGPIERPATSGRGPAQRPVERLPYVPFAAKDKSARMYIRGRVACHRIPWGYMPILTHAPWAFTQLIVTIPDLVVIIWGERLDLIADAIGLMTCDLIQEYDPRYFLEPTNPRAPLVTRIESRLRHGIPLDDERPATSVSGRE